MKIKGLIKKVIPKSLKDKIRNEMTIYTANKHYVLEQEEKLPLRETIAIVTGGSGAIGRAICFKLASKGAMVYVSGRTEENVKKVVNEINSLGLKARPLIVDITDEKSIDIRFDDVIRETGKVDILINCAGGGAREQISELARQDAKVIDYILDSNLRGAILCTRKAAKYMTEQGNGKIIIISSAVGMQGKASYSEYAAAKSGMFGFAKSMALELGKYGINVNCVTPGFIQRGEYTSKTEEWLKSTNCLHKVGTLEDVSNAVYFMISEEANFITGQNLVIDGGRTLGLYGDR